MRSSSFIFTIILACVFFSLQGQHPTLRNYTIKDGLPSSECYYAVQDSLGTIWIATDRGIVKFDNQNFKVFDEKNGMFQSTAFRLYVKDKRIWFFTANNFIQYIEEDTIHSAPFSQEIKRKVDNLTARISGLYFQGETLIVLISDNYPPFYYFKIDPLNEIHEYIISDSSTTLIQYENVAGITSSRELLASNDLTYISTFNETQESKKVRIQVNIDDYSKLNVLQLQNDKFIFQSSDELSLYQADSVLYRVNLNNRPISNSISPLGAGTFEIGFEYAPSKTYTTVENQIVELSYGQLSAIQSMSHSFIDREGGQWKTSLTNGLFYSPSSILLKQHLLQNEVIHAICTGDSGLFVLTNSSLYRLDTVSLKIRKLASVVNSMNNMIYRKDTLYIASTLLDKVPSNSKDYQIIPFYGYISQNLVKGDSLFIITDRGCRLFKNGKELVRELTNNVGSRVGYIWSNRLYIAGLNGLQTFDLNEGEGATTHSLSDFDNLQILSLTLFRNHLVVSTLSHGVYFLDKENEVVEHVILDEDGESIYLITDSDTVMWGYNDAGLYKMVFSTNSLSPTKFSYFNYSHGLPQEEIRSVTKLGDKMWLGTSNGLFLASAKELVPNAVKPLASISKVKVSNKEVDFDIAGTYPANFGELEIFFHSNTYKTSLSNKFKIRLFQGEDSIEYKISEHSSVRFVNLSPATYTFQVLAINNDGIESVAPAQYKFTILPPFYLTWWFISLTVLFVSLGIFAIFNYRYQQLQRNVALKDEMLMQKQKALTAQMNPHFIFNAMGSIQSLVIKNENDSAEDYLTKFAKLTRSILDDSSKLEIQLSLELERIRNYVEMENLRFNNQISFKTDIGQEVMQLNPAVPTMMVQTIIENSIIHGILPTGKSGEITFSVQKSGDLIKLEIVDDGIGINESKSRKRSYIGGKTSKGVFIIEERLQSYRIYYRSDAYQIKVVDRFQEEGVNGTRVTIVVPLKS